MGLKKQLQYAFAQPFLGQVHLVVATDGLSSYMIAGWAFGWRGYVGSGVDATAGRAVRAV